jgi:hypothetical protein
VRSRPAAVTLDQAIQTLTTGRAIPVMMEVANNRVRHEGPQPHYGQQESGRGVTVELVDAAVARRGGVDRGRPLAMGA